MQAIEQFDPDLVILAVFWFLFGVKVDLLLPGCYVHPMLCMLAGIIISMARRFNVLEVSLVGKFPYPAKLCSQCSQSCRTPFLETLYVNHDHDYVFDTLAPVLWRCSRKDTEQIVPVHPRTPTRCSQSRCRPAQSQLHADLKESSVAYIVRGADPGALVAMHASAAKLLLSATRKQKRKKPRQRLRQASTQKLLTATRMQSSWRRALQSFTKVTHSS